MSDAPCMTALNDALSLTFGLTSTAELRNILEMAKNPHPNSALADLVDEMGAEVVVSIVVSLVGSIHAGRLRGMDAVGREAAAGKGA